VLLNQCHFERLTGYSVFVRVGSGVVIKNSSVSYGPIFLSHLASGCTIRSNFFFDSQATVIDSGLFNNCSQNVWGKGAGLQVLTDDHGFNSLIPDADNVNRTGTDGWSITGSVVREHGHKNTGMAAVNPLKCTGGGYAARTLKVSANTFYVLRVGFKTEDNTIATQGGQVTISDAGGTLLSTGALTSDDNACGYIDYQSYAFKTGAYTTITIKIESLNSETIYFLVVDVARNACQENPSLEDTWSGGLPTANWEATNNISVSEYTADYHSGSKCIRIQAPAAVTSASECRVKALGLETGKTYECSFWVKDVTPANGFIYVQFGLGYIASAQYGVGNYGNYVIGISGWQKYTFQFVSNAGDADFVSLARLSPRTWERTLDILVDDITIVHVERDRPRWNRLTTASPSIDVYCDYHVIDSSSNAVNATLGDGRYIGQILMIVMEDSTNSSTVSVAHHETSDPEVGTFATVDETWVLMWTGTEWSTLKASCSF
jgi:hypothetical protein